MASDRRIKRWLLVFFITAHLGAPVATVAGDLEPATSGVVTRMAYGLAACLGQLSSKGERVVLPVGVLGAAFLVDLTFKGVVSGYVSTVATAAQERLVRRFRVLNPQIGDRNFELRPTETRADWVGDLPQGFDSLVNRKKRPEAYREFPQLATLNEEGVLLVGPPGTGKTMLARTIANELGARYFELTGSDAVTVWQGSGAQSIRDIFAQARAAVKSHGTAVIFFDELDSLARRRRGYGTSEESGMTTMMTELTKGDANKGIFVIGATNRVEDLDEAIKRSGRFGKHLEMGNPTTPTRQALIEYQKNKLWFRQEEPAKPKYVPSRLLPFLQHLSSRFVSEPVRHNFSCEKQPDEIAQETRDFSHADITSLMSKLFMRVVDRRVLADSGAAASATTYDISQADIAAEIQAIRKSRSVPSSLIERRRRAPLSLLRSQSDSESD